MKPVVVTSGKPAIFDVIEAQTGKYAFSIDLGLQNFVLEIDPETGAKKTDPRLVPGDGQTKFVCPHAVGGKNWLPSSVNPTSKVLFVSLVEACMNLMPVDPGERGLLSTGARLTLVPPRNSDGMYGRLEAINLETRQSVWELSAAARARWRPRQRVFPKLNGSSLQPTTMQKGSCGGHGSTTCRVR